MNSIHRLLRIMASIPTATIICGRSWVQTPLDNHFSYERQADGQHLYTTKIAIPGIAPERLELAAYERHLELFGMPWTLLPADCDASKLEARAQHGALVVTVPRIAGRKIEVQVG